MHSDVLSFACFFFGSLVFTALTMYQLYVYSMLGTMVDRFCLKFMEESDNAIAMVEWNIIQAMLRSVTGAFDSCFLTTQTTALVALLVSAVQMMQVQWLEGTIDESPQGIVHVAMMLVPPAVLALSGGTVFFTAAAVTEKCSRVPALVNSMLLDGVDDDVELMLYWHERQCVVQYIMNSAAGFYIKEVRLTASVALKLAYTTGLCFFAVLTKIVSDSSSRE
eukprot:gnl/TRDRNA2_/TRDRNA2_164545_c0_seq1.p1 gnl/TRDRNA2_/TRDRNA2_164545_c0~~gnl/TRDRNA2_/TRDRNA2_164545_c0_seq1.p1  ORF type:complete len:252 (+),score=62.56 gnl/TRDRNA2_/TRDRNA2_164545_c0_seq1:95-757(+)